MTPWKSEAIKKQLEEETGNLMRWEADEEVANKELDAKLKQIAEVKAAQNAEIEALERENEIRQRRVAMAEQKKEEIQRKALFTQRKAEVLLERFNMFPRMSRGFRGENLLSRCRHLNLNQIYIFRLLQILKSEIISSVSLGQCCTCGGADKGDEATGSDAQAGDAREGCRKGEGGGRRGAAGKAVG